MYGTVRIAVPVIRRNIMDYGRIKVAVVDDDSVTRQMINTYMSVATGYEAVLFGSGQELLDYLHKDSVEIIVLDIEMEGMNGLDTYEKLQHLAGASDIPVMFLTEKGDRETVLKCIDRGADDFMVKPVSRESFLSKLDGILANLDEFRADKTIMLVDDDKDFSRLVSVKLSKYYKVVTEDSGKAALEYLEKNAVDLILLDYFMPLYDGGKVLAILKHREKTRNIPVIMLSSVPEEEIRSVCKDNPPEGVAIKNGHLEDLLVMINGLL
jgi:CheY-like chemotaxis protein